MCTLSQASHAPSLQSSVICRGLVVNWTARVYLRPSNVDGRNEHLQDCLPITSQQLSHATRHYHQRTRETVISHTSFRPRKAVVGGPVLKYEAV